MILYVSSVHALKDEMKADSICVLFMSEEGDRIGAETGKAGHGRLFRKRFLTRFLFSQDSGS